MTVERVERWAWAACFGNAGLYEAGLCRVTGVSPLRPTPYGAEWDVFVEVNLAVVTWPG